MTTPPSLSETKDAIRLLMEYAVNPEDMDKARTLVENYQSDRIALHIFHEFYSYLPEAENDAIQIIRNLEHKGGTFLLAASTLINTYLYIANQEGAVFLGRHQDGIWDEDVYNFLECNREDAQKKYKELETFPVYVPAHLNQKLCASCSVSHGEYHRLGCPVEICPWCSGQLANCNCRFSKLGKDQLKSEKDLNAFMELLTQKGRIRFDSSEQSLSFPAGMKKE